MTDSRADSRVRFESFDDSGMTVTFVHFVLAFSHKGVTEESCSDSRMDDTRWSERT